MCFALFTGTLALALTSCLSGAGGQSRDVVDDGSIWAAASPVLAQQIEDEAERLPWTHGFERLEQIRWFAALGEPAYAKLLQLAADERDDVAAAALAALGATRDRRLVPAIRELDWSAERLAGDLGLERARSLVRLGDWNEIPRLIQGLEDGRVYTRSLCADALAEATGDALGFNPRDADEARADAIARWRAWWVARGGEGLLTRK
jgi:HEAT repeat protein